MVTIDLSGKTALILGVANQRSLGWAIAEALGQAGCRMAFTYQGDRLREKVTSLVEKFPGSPVMECDVRLDDQVDDVFGRIHAKGFTGIVGMEHGNAGGGKEGERAVIDAYRAVDPA